MYLDLSYALTLKHCVTVAAAALNMSFNQLCESSSVKLQAAAEEEERQGCQQLLCRSQVLITALT